MNSLKVSVNSDESLSQNESFAKFYMPLDEMELKTMSKAELLSIKNELTLGMNRIKSKKNLFIYSTNQHPKSRSYKNQMLQFELRKNQLNENMSKVNKYLLAIKEDFLQNENLRKENESNYLFYFWKTAKDVLKASEYKKISEITQTFAPFPETLIR